MQLERAGIRATQATISRDLRELGAVKGPSGYELPTDQQRRDGAGLGRALQAYLLSAKATGVLVVLRTGAGHAQIVALELDRTPPEGVLGNIAGDDTIFVATTSEQRAQRLESELRGIAGLGGDEAFS